MWLRAQAAGAITAKPAKAQPSHPRADALSPQGREDPLGHRRLPRPPASDHAAHRTTGAGPADARHNARRPVLGLVAYHTVTNLVTCVGCHAKEEGETAHGPHLHPQAASGTGLLC